MSRVAVVGIGADGWTGLGEAARAAIGAADTLIGSQRQLDLVPAGPAERRPWPSPIDPLLDALVAGALNGKRVCVLASGDPMLHGIGATLAKRIGCERLDVHPHPSAFALACARLGWSQAETELVSAVACPVDAIARSLQPRRRLVAYVTGSGGAAAAARAVTDRGFGASRFVVLERLGHSEERITDTTAAAWGETPADPLHAVAIETHADGPLLPRIPGLPDDAYDSDGALTKREVRAITLAALAPAPHALLWDVGAGSGSIAIEWLRAEPTARAVAIESRADRAERAVRNACALGVPDLDVRTAEAPAAFESLDPPDAVFIGGGITRSGVLDAAWAALNGGGRLVANAVTLEAEAVLAAAQASHGGTLTRIGVDRAAPLGSFTAWRAQIPIVQWAAEKQRP